MSATHGTITNSNSKQNTCVESTTILGIGSNVISIVYNYKSNAANLAQCALSTDRTNKKIHWQYLQQC